MDIATLASNHGLDSDMINNREINGFWKMLFQQYCENRLKSRNFGS